MKQALFAIVSLLLVAAQPSEAEQNLQALLDTAATYRLEGNVRRALEILEHAQQAAGPSAPPRLAGELGVTYYQAHRFQEAEAKLKDAYTRSADAAERARYANDIGNLHASRGLTKEAVGFFEEAKNASSAEPQIRLSAGLNLARLAPAEKRQDQLVQLSGQIADLAEPHQRARYFLNLGNQARVLGPPALKLAYESLHAARTLARQAGDRVLLAEALDELSQLYEDQGRGADAMKLADEAIVTLPAEQGKDLLITLHWRRARLLRQQGDNDQALRAYQSAVEHIEAIRQDIPVKYIDGRSSFRETLEPIYLGLADLLLRKAASEAEIDRRQLFRRARDTVELVKQTELQDYLGERCSVESVNPQSDDALPQGTAVLYPVMLKDRLELMIETRRGIESRQVSIAATALRAKALGFAKSLREGGLDYLPRAKDLDKVLLRPLEDVLMRHGIKTIVVIPDGALRLIPMGALHDGNQFAVEKYEIVIAPGLTITGAVPRKAAGKILLAGVSEPGPAVEKLPQSVVDEFHAEQSEIRSAELRKNLALPGVKQEIDALKKNTRSDALLDSAFTVERFRRQLGASDYRVVHIASHAMFNRRSATSFIMAYDDILTIDDLQNLLRTEQQSPIEILTLSACQTAEGDDRAPLGIAGAVLKARASSALGSLWPVADEATKALMLRFYELLAGGKVSKSKALQTAQLELSRTPEYQHPYYWAPFILVGGWQ